MNTRSLLFVTCATLGLVALPQAYGDPKDAPKDREGSRESSSRKSPPEFFESLTHEEREKVRATFAKVWNDPAVVQSRDEVGRATKAYKEAMSAAIKAVDPETAEILARVQKEHGEGERRGFLDGMDGRGPKGKSKGKPRPDGSGGGDRVSSGVVRMVEMPPFLKDLSEEDRAIYQAARMKASETEAVKSLTDQLGEIRKEDESRRERRVELFETLLRTYQKEMVAADPRVAAMLPKGRE